MDEDDYFEEEDYDPETRPRDGKIDEAKEHLLTTYFPPGSERVYYGRQVETFVEKRFYHWITKKALNELAAEGKITMIIEERGETVAHMYLRRGYRYPKRQITEIVSLIASFSEPMFTRALGQHGEMLADAAIARTGFRVRQTKVRSVGALAWTATKHDLDRLIERDGVGYGVEIKNQLGYIDKTELEIKIAMCAHLGLRPLFIARMMPKSYIWSVQQAGGFCLILDNQHYPLLADQLASRVRTQLGLPVLCIRELPDTTFKRFVRWHEGGHVALQRRKV